MSRIVGLGPCYHAIEANFKSDVAFCRNTRPRNRPDFVKNVGHVRGAVMFINKKSYEANHFFTMFLDTGNIE